jgi:hypothetical protein
LPTCWDRFHCYSQFIALAPLAVLAALLVRYSSVDGRSFLPRLGRPFHRRSTVHAHATYASSMKEFYISVLFITRRRALRSTVVALSSRRDRALRHHAKQPHPTHLPVGRIPSQPPLGIFPSLLPVALLCSAQYLRTIFQRTPRSTAPSNLRAPMSARRAPCKRARTPCSNCATCLRATKARVLAPLSRGRRDNLCRQLRVLFVPPVRFFRSRGRVSSAGCGCRACWRDVTQPCSC